MWWRQHSWDSIVCAAYLWIEEFYLMAALARCLLRVITTSWGIDFAPVYSQIPPLPHIRTSPSHLSIGLAWSSKRTSSGKSLSIFSLLLWNFVSLVNFVAALLSWNGHLCNVRIFRDGNVFLSVSCIKVRTRFFHSILGFDDRTRISRQSKFHFASNTPINFRCANI